MISPATSQGNERKSTRRLPPAEDFNVVSQLGIVGFGERSGSGPGYKVTATTLDDLV